MNEENTNKPYTPILNAQKEEEIRQFKLANSPILNVLEMVFYLTGSLWFILHMFI